MKSKIDTKEKSNVVYEIKCNGNEGNTCGMLYVGTTKNKLQTRMNGHKSDLRTRNKNHEARTALSDHCATQQHTPDLDNVRVLGEERHHNKRLTLEMLHISNIPTQKRINYKADTDNVAHIYRNLIRRN